jgi:hypothetical protein
MSNFEISIDYQFHFESPQTLMLIILGFDNIQIRVKLLKFENSIAHQ